MDFELDRRSLAHKIALLAILSSCQCLCKARSIGTTLTIAATLSPRHLLCSCKLYDAPSAHIC